MTPRPATGFNGVFLACIAAMILVVVASNYLVQFPVMVRLGGVNLADLLTWGAFTYPVAFLITDITNRLLGPGRARLVVVAGFLLAVVLSIWLATPRLALASGSAFLVAQMLDVAIFQRLRDRGWWQAPLASSLFGSLVDTALFFSLAFAAQFAFLGYEDAFALEYAALLGVFDVELPRWMSWAVGDLMVKLGVALALLLPYRAISGAVRGPAAAA